MLSSAAPAVLSLSFVAACACQGPAATWHDTASSSSSSDHAAAAGASPGMIVWRRYKTTSVATCQVMPIDVASTEAFDWRAVGRWPGGAVLAHQPTVGEKVQVFEEPVKKIVDLRLHGEPADVTIDVRFQGVRRESRETGGDSLVFELALSAIHSDAGMCHQWTSEAHATGELVLRSSDGAVVALSLHGPMSDSEALCPEGAKETGVGAEPRTCNRGEMWLTLKPGSTAPLP